MSFAATRTLPGRRRPAIAQREGSLLAPAAALFFKGYNAVRSRQLATEDTAASQQAQLRKLLGRAQATRIGRDHGFARIGSIAEYQAAVPLRTYDQLWSAYWRDGFPTLTDATWPGQLPFFAVSSGTSSGKVKYIPCSLAMVAANKRAALDICVNHARARPDTRFHDGQFFVLGGSTNLTVQAPGVRSGDVSGIAGATTPWWARAAQFPPADVRFLTDWEEKLNRMAPLSLQRRIKAISGSPPWMLVLFEKLAQLTGSSPARLADIYPELELIVHGGVGFAPYAKRFAELLAGSHARLQEVYAASEGVIAIADRGPGEGMRLVTDNGSFYEFVPVAELGSPNPTRHWVGNVQPGVDYAIVLTTCAGLWSYVIGDVVRFTDTKVPRLLVTSRTAYMLSSFGEHVTGELVETCLFAAAREARVDLREFTAGTEFATDGSWGRHTHFVELDGEPDEAAIQRFATQLDSELAARNEDYAERRVVPTGLQPPRVTAVAPGSFNAWMRSIGKQGGQHKVPRVLKTEQLDNLRQFMGERTVGSVLA